MTQVLLIRPGSTVYDEENRVQGVLDVPLSDRGRAEVIDLADRLIGSNLQFLYCGPSESVIRTATAIAETLGLRTRRLDGLRNLDQGLWQGLQIEEIKRRNVKLFRQWLEDPKTICPPQGETVESAMNRVRAALKPVLRKHSGEAIGLVVADPIARLISCFLRCVEHVQLLDPSPAAGFERIVLADQTNPGRVLP